MKLVVVSDSHGSDTEIKDIYNTYNGKVDGFVHCGDSELKSSDKAMAGYLAVRGNCDMDPSYPEVLTAEFSGTRILATHGHLYNIKMTLMNLNYLAEENQAEMVFFGHSHQLGAEQIEDVLFVNPGSILLPRGRNERTYALIEKDEKSVSVKFFDHNHKEIVDLSRNFFV
ncbi:metallophosphoesterase [Bacillus salacetis]|uniref:Phosphoesterase n=1 Tax=Bacillus salacetis TaxID=2315464 RepID=A0A3A1R583_9BACI|nr:metallophosphoesterase [Bacillus salacetis]RIW37734.1 metallophosphoesterase [Bacillus salacetis]